MTVSKPDPYKVISVLTKNTKGYQCIIIAIGKKFGKAREKKVYFLRKKLSFTRQGKKVGKARNKRAFFSNARYFHKTQLNIGYKYNSYKPPFKF